MIFENKLLLVNIYKNIIVAWCGGAHLIPSAQEAEHLGFSELEGSLVCIVSSRTVRALQRDSVRVVVVQYKPQHFNVLKPRLQSNQ